MSDTAEKGGSMLIRACTLSSANTVITH